MQYELMYIVPASVMDDDIGRIEGEVKALIEKVGASLIETKRLGKFRFTYPIKKERHGHYILVQFEGAPSTVAPLDRLLLITPNVLRHLILRADEAAGPYTISQFVEINLDNKEDRPRRRKTDGTEEKAKSTEEIKSGVAAIEGKATDAVEEKKVESLSEEELNKKLDAALTGDAKDA